MYLYFHDINQSDKCYKYFCKYVLDLQYLIHRTAQGAALHFAHGQNLFNITTSLGKRRVLSIIRFRKGLRFVCISIICWPCDISLSISYYFQYCCLIYYSVGMFTVPEEIPTQCNIRRYIVITRWNHVGETRAKRDS